MGSPILGEFLGTAVLVLLGDGVNANVLLKKSYAHGAGCTKLPIFHFEVR